MEFVARVVALCGLSFISVACTTGSSELNANNDRASFHRSADATRSSLSEKKRLSRTYANSDRRVVNLYPPAVTRKKARVVTIRNDRGGQLFQYAKRIKRASDRGDLVRVAGNCDSACTMFLALPKKQLCLTPRAQFRFHRPYGASQKSNQAASRFMMRTYPHWVRRWIVANGGLSSSLKTMKYSYASRYLKTCPSRNANDRKLSIPREIKRIRQI
ncbi:MAG: hypothetical protein AB3N20_18360 [Rhizobiaceae bacterium]